MKDTQSGAASAYSRELPVGARQRSSSAPITVLSRVPKLSGVVGDAGRARYSAADMSVSYEAAQAVN